MKELTLWRTMFRILPAQIRLWPGIALIVTAQLAGLGIPYLLKFLVDGFVSGPGEFAIWTIAVIWLGLQAIHAICQYAGQIALVRLGEDTQLHLRHTVFNKLMAQPVLYHLAKPVGEHLNLVEVDSSYVNLFFSSFLPSTIRLGLGVVATAVVLAVLEPQILLIAIVPIPAVLIFFAMYRGRSKGFSRKLRETTMALYALENESLTAIETVKVYGLESKMAEQMLQVSGTHRDVAVAKARFSSKLTVALSMGSLVMLGAILLGGQFVASGKISIGDLVAAYAYLAMVLAPLKSAPNLLIQWGQVAVSTERLADLLADDPEPTDHAADVALPEGPWSVECDHVSFGYPGQSDAPACAVWNDLSMSVESGSSVVLLGPSGAGKSTTGKIFSRLLNCQSGEVRINGVPLAQLPVATFRERIGYVDQDAALFTGTIEENILAGLPGGLPDSTATERLAKAVATAQVGDILQRKHVSLTSHVARAGANLSTGQRKRVALARALMRDPSLLIIDQMASDLDDILNESVFTALRRDYELTLIYLGHRIPPGLNPDAVYRLDGGAISN